MHVAILVDASNSMMFEEKFALARHLATAFAVIGLRNQEKVSVYALRSPIILPPLVPYATASTGAPPRLAPCTGRASQAKMFAFLESIEGGGDAPIEQGIESFLRQHTGRGVVIVLSDFLTAGDLKRAFSLLHGSGLEVFALQILGPGEINPDITGDLRFVDSETVAHLDVSSAGDLLAIYQEYRAAHQQMLETLAQRRSGRFISVSASEPFERVFFDLLRRKGWIV